MSAEPRFSVVIPCYNVAQTIAATLDTLCYQTYRDFEVVLVDDGCTDESMAIVQTFAGRLPLVVHTQTNQGLGAARNAGIDRSTGQYVAFLDADDLWDPTKLERVSAVATTDAPDLICHDERMLVNGQDAGVLRHGPFVGYHDLLFQGNCLSPSAVSVRRERLVEVGKFSTDKRGHGAEDWDLWLKLTRAGASVVYLHELLGTYVIATGNMSTASDFGVRCRHVFEVHVQQLEDQGTLEDRIRGARAIHLIQDARASFASGALPRGISSMLDAMKEGLTSTFFWVLVAKRGAGWVERRAHRLHSGRASIRSSSVTAV